MAIPLIAVAAVFGIFLAFADVILFFLLALFLVAALYAFFCWRKVQSQPASNRQSLKEVLSDAPANWPLFVAGALVSAGGAVVVNQAVTLGLDAAAQAAQAILLFTAVAGFLALVAYYSFKQLFKR